MLAAAPPSSGDRPAHVAPAPGRVPQAAPPSGSSFSDLLQRGQATHGVLAAPAAVPHARAETARDGGAEGSDAAAADGLAPAVATTTPPGAKAAGRTRGKAAPANPAAPARPTIAADGNRAKEAEAPTRPGSDTADAVGMAPAGAMPAADLRDWLAALKLPGTSASAAADGATLAVAAHAGRDGTVAAAAAEGSADATDKAIPPRPALLDAGPDDDPRAVAGSVAEPAGARMAALAPIVLPAPLHSPEFAQALGAQVSLLVSEGVQQAELHLHPAELGPISVQIQIDGQAAHVDFSASAAATRDVIERSLPELASALREQGLTLAGGGVFQQQAGAHDPPGREVAYGADRARRRASATATTPRPIAVALPQGRLDLYV